MNNRNHFQYLYFRLLDYVAGELPEHATGAEVAKFEEDHTLLHFLAHRAMTDYSMVGSVTRRKVVNFSAARRNGGTKVTLSARAAD